MNADVPAGVNYERVCRWFAGNVPGAAGAELRFELIGDGRSNLTYRVRGGGQEWVMRRPPLGHVLPTAHDMVREYRVQSALAGTDVPVPRTVALCEDPAVNDYPFYVMGYLDGVIVADAIPPGFADTPAERRRMCDGLVATLVRLHAVDYRAVGLGDFAFKPEGYLERQVRRWSEQWQRSKQRDVPAFDELHRRLRAALPVSPPPTIVHGDYRFGNVVLAKDDPGRVIGILDWEMSTLGDPLADLAWVVGWGWGEKGDPDDVLDSKPAMRVTTADGFMTRAEVVAAYGRLSGRDVSAMDYYRTFTLYKLAIIHEGIYARHVAGETVGEKFEGMESNAGALFQQALAIADASADRRLRGEA